MPKVKLYVEGGGESNALRTACRRGFRQFLEKAGLTGRMPQIVACGSRNDAFNSFCTALKQNRDELPLLLVDSETLVVPNNSTWDHLHQRDNWIRPQGANDNHAHLMAQCMETWLIADMDTLANYFGNGFNRNNLPQNPDLEAVAKQDIYRSFANATRQTSKGAYSKGDHSFEILARINPNLTRNRCSHADRLVAFLLETL
jgi:hypothetical protein